MIIISYLDSRSARGERREPTTNQRKTGSRSRKSTATASIAITALNRKLQKLTRARKIIKMATEAPIDENAVIAKYKELQNECSSLITKITELEVDRNEHK